jgi:hypothetical protein
VVSVLLRFCLLLAPLGAAAQPLDDQRLALIEDPLQIEFPPVPVEKVRQAIVGAATGQDWEIKDESLTRFQLTRKVRGQHEVNVELSYDADIYTIRYLDSTNLLYREKDRSGAPVRAIHRNYNAWVRQLAAAINASLGVPAKTWVVSSSSGGIGKGTNMQAAPIPERLKIVPPAEGTPAASKVFAGAWQGKWGSELDHILIAERIEGRTVHFVYSYGTSRSVPMPGFRRGSGTVDENGVLRIVTSNGTQISYEPSRDGQSLEAQYQQGARISSATLKRRPLSD